MNKKTNDNSCENFNKNTEFYSEDSDQFIENMNTELARKGMTKKELAKALGVSPSTITKRINGCTFDCITLIKAINIIGCSINDIFTVKGGKKIISKEESELDSIIKELEKYSNDLKMLSDEFQKFSECLGTISQNLHSVSQILHSLKKYL